jgi:hypothetical protein
MISSAIIVLTWNSFEDTISCLQSVLTTSSTNAQVIVCDNASTDGSWQRFLDWANDSGRQYRTYNRSSSESGGKPDDPGLIFIQTGTNLGFAGGNNVGLRYALNRGHQYFWLLSNDTMVNRHSLPALIERTQQDTRIGMCGSTLIYFHDQCKVQALGGSVFDFSSGVGTHIGIGESLDQDVYATNKPSGLAKRQKYVEESMDYVVGASMLVTREFIEAIGLMEESYFLFFEEIDWAMRGKEKFKLGWAPDSIVIHKEGGSIGSSHIDRPSRTALTYMARNRLKFAARHTPEHYWSVWRRLCFEALVYAKRRDIEAVKLLITAVIRGITLRIC